MLAVVAKATPPHCLFALLLAVVAFVCSCCCCCFSIHIGDLARINRYKAQSRTGSTIEDTNTLGHKSFFCSIPSAILPRLRLCGTELCSPAMPRHATAAPGMRFTRPGSAGVAGKCDIAPANASKEPGESISPCASPQRIQVSLTFLSQPLSTSYIRLRATGWTQHA